MEARVFDADKFKEYICAADGVDPDSGKNRAQNIICVFDVFQRFHGWNNMISAPRMVSFMAQTSHESGGFLYRQEIWGPTAAQLKYEGRKDLGNTQPGDGFNFRGRDFIQLTGRANYVRFSKWAEENLHTARNWFVDDPDRVSQLMNLGSASYWFWTEGNSTGEDLGLFADAGNFEAITRKINGGLNGYEDRCERYVNYALILLRYYFRDVNRREVIKKFQEDVGFTGKDVDGIAGVKTRAKLHERLRAMEPIYFAENIEKEAPLGVASAAGPENEHSWNVTEDMLTITQPSGGTVFIPRGALISALEWVRRSR